MWIPREEILVLKGLEEFREHLGQELRRSHCSIGDQHRDPGPLDEPSFGRRVDLQLQRLRQRPGRARFARHEDEAEMLKR